MTRVLLSALLVAAVAATSQAQTAPGQIPPMPPPGMPTGGPDTSLSAPVPTDYRREVFVYPRNGRPNPMQPPSSLATSGSETDLAVAGIVLDLRRPERTSAMIRATGFERDRYVVRVGDRIDQYRVVEITARRVVLAVPVPGGTRTVVLERERDRPSTTTTGDASRAGRRTQAPGQQTRVAPTAPPADEAPAAQPRGAPRSAPPTGGR